MTTIMPCYLAIDTSASTANVIDDMRNLVRDLIALLRRSPVTADLLPLTVIGFSTEARIVFSSSSVEHASSVPFLEASGSTSYAPVFELARRLIDQDVARYKTEGYSVHRPALFFLTDGNPTDAGWEEALAELKSPEFRPHPNIVAIGYGAVDPSLIAAIGSRGSFFVSDRRGGVPAAEVLKGVESMFQSLKASVVSADAHFAAPTELPPGWIDVADIEQF